LPAIAAPVGDIKRFLLACLPRARSQQATLSAVYERYCRRCEENGLSALGATEFAVDFKAIAARYGIRTQQDGTKIYCLDVRLVA
jgi:hypothetical protein